MEDLNYQMLFLRGTEILKKPSSYLNDNALSHLLLDARMKGYDGREIIAKAWQMEYGTGNAQIPVNILNVGVLSKEEPRTGVYICKGCNKGFESSTALNGHGEKRCLKKSNL